MPIFDITFSTPSSSDDPEAALRLVGRGMVAAEAVGGSERGDASRARGRGQIASAP